MTQITEKKSNKFEVAMTYFASEQYALSLKYAEEYLKSNPNNKNTLKLIAYIQFKDKQFSSALTHLSKLIETNQADAEICNLIGSVFLEAGDYPQSILFLEKSLSLDKHFVNAYINLSLALQKNNQFAESKAVCEKANTLFPATAPLLEQYANTLFSMGDFHLSRSVYSAWLTIDSTSTKANIGMARCSLVLKDTQSVMTQLTVLEKNDKSLSARLDVTNELLKQGETKAAIASYLRLVNAFSQKESLFNNIASAYDQQGNPDKAIEYFKKSLNENNQYVAALSNIGRVYTDFQAFSDAEHHLKKALTISPNNINALINISRLYEHRRMFSEAKVHLLYALKLAPNNPIIHCNLANALHHLGDPIAANQHYKTCLSIDQNYGDAEQNLGINELALGKFDTAWGHYFKRLRVLDRGEQLSTIIPGMSFEGKHVYFFRSQGLGDEIFFLRFLPMLKSQNIEVTYRASKKTYALFSQITEIDHLINEDDPIPECDYYFSIDDLPLILNMNHISKIPTSLTLIPKPSLVKKIQKEIDKYPPPYTGITWRAGNQPQKGYNKDSRRVLNKEVPLKSLCSSIKKVEGSIVILQRYPSKDEIDYISKTVNCPVIDFSEYNVSLDDMLAALSLIDHYIGVSNTNTHLFSALDKAADVLVPFPPDWRWMNEGDRSPWFPDVKIYRQSSLGSWDSALQKLTSYIIQCQTK